VNVCSEEAKNAPEPPKDEYNPPSLFGGMQINMSQSQVVEEVRKSMPEDPSKTLNTETEKPKTPKAETSKVEQNEGIIRNEVI